MTLLFVSFDFFTVLIRFSCLLVRKFRNIIIFLISQHLETLVRVSWVRRRLLLLWWWFVTERRIRTVIQTHNRSNLIHLSFFIWSLGVGRVCNFFLHFLCTKNYYILQSQKIIKHWRKIFFILYHIFLCFLTFLFWFYWFFHQNNSFSPKNR